jgi:hypothetical protein
MRSRNSFETLPGLRNALDTVMLDMPSFAATSSKVARPELDARTFRLAGLSVTLHAAPLSVAE